MSTQSFPEGPEQSPAKDSPPDPVLSSEEESEFLNASLPERDGEHSSLGAFLAAFGAALEKTKPRRSGEVLSEGVNQPVSIGRDERGFVQIKATSFDDAAFAQGFVHAQERFLQMDLTRRKMRAQLSELLGKATLESDVHYASLELGQVANAIERRLPGYEREILEKYAEGVNEGISDLEFPWEYTLLEQAPEPWSVADSILCSIAMSDDLNDGAAQEISKGALKSSLPREVYDFLFPVTSRFDTALLSEQDRKEYTPTAIPDASVINLRDVEPMDLRDGCVKLKAARAGSNAWVLGGERTTSGAAMLANDPHLDLSNPGVFFQSQLELPDRRIVGLTVPGCPGITIGSNGKVAWGFTNLGADFRDLVQVETDPRNPERYLTSFGSESFEKKEALIHVRGESEPYRHHYTKTLFGPVVGTDEEGKTLSLRWTALDPEKTNFAILRLQSVGTVEEALGVARSWFGPAQNFMVAGADGKVGWTVTGYLPRRSGVEGDVPEQWDNLQGWNGVAEERRPSRIGRREDAFVTANNRNVSAEDALALGNYFSLGVRAARINELLAERSQFSEADNFAIQLDTRVSLLEFYRELVLKNDTVGDREFSAVASRWDGQALEESVGLAFLEEFRRAVHTELIGPLIAPVTDKDPSFTYFNRQGEEVVRRLFDERPEHLLNSKFDSWDSLISDCMNQAKGRLESLGMTLDTAWGEYNLLSVQHPLSPLVPHSQGVLSLEALAMAGHPHAVRVTQSSFGAAARIVVSPGKEEEGILQIGGAQSGHPQSDSFRRELLDWLEGNPKPLLVGEQTAQFEVRPSPSLVDSASAQELEIELRNDFVLSKKKRVADTVLFASRIFNPLCSKQEARSTSRPTEPLPIHLRKRFSIPSYKERELEKIEGPSGMSRYVGKIEIDGRVRSFDCFVPQGVDYPVPFVTLLPITEGGFALNQLVATRLAKHGIASGTLTRAPRIFQRGETLSDLEADLRRGVREQRAFLSYVSDFKEVDSERLASVGISLGGIIASGLGAIDPRIKANVVAVAGADFPALIRRTAFDMVQDWMTGLVDERGEERKQILQRIDRVLRSDPNHLAKYVDPDKVLMITAKNDSIIPRFNSDSLWERLGQPERLFVPFGHYGSVLMLDWIVQQAGEFVQHRFEERES